MDPLAWLGLRKERSHLSALHAEISQLLPDDEAVVVRYMTVVAVLLTRVAHADGRVYDSERKRLVSLFRHADRLPPEGIEHLCTSLDEQVPKMSEDEINTCYAELRSLCDAQERLQVVRLLARQATADGEIHVEEHGTLVEIAKALGISEDVLEESEIVAMAEERADRAASGADVPAAADADAEDDPTA